MPRSKKHHFVPKVLQRQFRAEGKIPEHRMRGLKPRDCMIWYSEKNPDGSFSAPNPRNIDDVFHKPNLNTVLVDGERSDVVEREFYHAIDTYLGEILPTISNAFAAEKVPTFSGEPLASLRTAMYEMAKRTPDFPSGLDERTAGEEYLRTLLEKMSNEAEHERLRVEADLRNEEQVRMHGRNLRVRATIRPSETVEEALKPFVARWCLTDRRQSFILSSGMVYRIGNGGPNGLKNPNMEMWMPVSPKHAIVLLQPPHHNFPMTYTADSRMVRQINEHAMRISQQIGSHSRALLESLTRKSANLD